ncbi:MAG: hypothetical protein KUA43_11010 [Hoeflea sp.]|uniref:hypothetical protein n=1 Tax=Hoeflea sp. TaxID=1940281 RepID=UPI001DA90D5C|nr:hypothetical protein [Hoeflea sp.]MBU4529633.1 hypothetical protein [Alphaproteobacteria bacterium]MBU4546752.1 hypothetical protein [Alphaproteobacteria bacterium]MBU4551020.1 hypothetical protein [Alphaproteobacteria bacterium]MBV1723962.1 hypothetical protein [Hoeflea sp.]MBV1763239.1 hypothetical protein [Hoeflea sp.]
MWRRALQGLGVLVVLGAIGIWWLLDLYGCEFNPGGCSRILPRPTLDAMLVLSLPVALGLWLIWLGRSKH